VYKRLDVKSSGLETLIDDFESAFVFLGNDGPVFYLETTDAAPRGRVVAVDTRKPGRAEWRELVGQTDSTIESASMVGDRFFISYLEDAKSVVRVFDLAGEPVGDVDLPGIGSAWGFGGDRAHDETFYGYAGFTVPTAIYRYDLATNTSSEVRKPTIAFDPTAFETKQVFATSKDGTRVPIFITHKKGLELDGNNPTILYGYGGFNISITPWFSVMWEVWAEMGGVVAVANLRGGGEYGEEWHDAGRLLVKQNVFDDFAAAAEWLTQNGYTSSDKLGITGNSNGGLLVGASITQRPELFGAAVAGVGVHDMLRFHEFTIGWAWIDDYGSADDPEQFEALYAYSPLHNVRPGVSYPPTLLTTADHDDRVVPAHSYKFVSQLQAHQAGTAPVLIRIETKAGHGSGKPTSKQIEEAADKLAFFADLLGAELPEVTTSAR
jgi:prolyl oligopeptidase